MIKLHQKSTKQNLHHRQIFSSPFDAMNLSHCILITNSSMHTVKIQHAHRYLSTRTTICRWDESTTFDPM